MTDFRTAMIDQPPSPEEVRQQFLEAIEADLVRLYNRIVMHGGYLHEIVVSGIGRPLDFGAHPARVTCPGGPVRVTGPRPK